MPNLAALPRPISERRKQAWDFPHAVDQEHLDPVIRKAITVDARMKPDYPRLRVPLLAIYQAQRPFEEVAGGYTIRNDQPDQPIDSQRTLSTACSGGPPWSRVQFLSAAGRPAKAERR